ncbi:superoxide dismutase [Clostridium sp. SHJSY1]|uniref:superoxide dismutase n=1 Tax=Clostridium sp. SHJSY1 TaxID=2942483 RepID=UPI002875B207|nr:superoxide dismutase [Clostridium sp. SHJSY1]MDS0526433.1 superoxide dismutase [Clostridium sp. SHJSY1]
MFDKIKLPYEYNELEPYIDALTVETHYGKHHQKYLDTLNGLVKENEDFFKGKTLSHILANLDEVPEKIRQGVINHGGGVENHNLYFSILSPKAKKSPDGKFLEEINKTFGDLEKLKTQISEAAIVQFGSGYAFLVKDKSDKLLVKTAMNQNSPLSEGYIPLLTIDVWEHAYYLKYKNLRPDYVKNIWNVIDWEKIQGLFEHCD